MTSILIRYWSPRTKSPFDIWPSDHHFAFFFIHCGIDLSDADSILVGISIIFFSPLVTKNGSDLIILPSYVEPTVTYGSFFVLVGNISNHAVKPLSSVSAKYIQVLTKVSDNGLL